MKYSFVLAGLAASAIATPYVNVEVTADGLGETHRGRNHEHGVGRHHDRDGNDRGHWWSSLFGRPRSHSRGRGRREPSRDRRGRGRSMKPAGYDDDGYYCQIKADNRVEELKSTLECCRRYGGQFHVNPLHCILKEHSNPREFWRECAEDQPGVESAECYPPNEREIDEELADRGPRGHRKNHRKNHRNGDDRMTILDDGRDGEIVCRVEMSNPDWRREVLEECCRDEVHGRIEGDNQVCLMDYDADIRRFERCVLERGAEDVRCSGD